MPVNMSYWRNLIKEKAESIADENYQRNEWINNKGKTSFFPDEMFCGFFDDASAEDFFQGMIQDSINNSLMQGKALLN